MVKTEERGKEAEGLFKERRAENFPNEGKTWTTKFTALWSQCKKNLAKTHDETVKIKIKEQILKAAREEKIVTYKKSPLDYQRISLPNDLGSCY